jgi:MATE family multidrug resistance protein
VTRRATGEWPNTKASGSAYPPISLATIVVPRYPLCMASPSTPSDRDPRHSLMPNIRALLVLGLPLTGGHLAQIAISVTDTVMLGWYSVDALAAAVLGTAWFFNLFLVGSGFGWAVMPLVAEAAERGDQIALRRATRMGLWLSFGFAVLALPAMMFSAPILQLLGQPAELANAAQEYLRIAMWGLPAALGVMVLKSYLAALEKTNVVLWVTLTAAAINAVVNYGLIFGNFGLPELGLRGAALGSVIVQAASFVLLIVYARRMFPEHALFHRLWRPDVAAMGKVFHLGWPIGLTNFSESGLFLASTLMMGSLGTVPVAAHGIAIQIASATFMFHMGISNGATVRAGRALGRRDPEGLAQGGRAAIVVSVAFALLTMVVFVLFPELLIGSFIDPEDLQRDAILALGTTLLAMAALFQLADGLQVMALGMLRGVQDTRVPMLQAAFAYWCVGLPVSYLLGFKLEWGGVGIWAGLIVGLSVAAALLMHRFWRRTLPQVGSSAYSDG